MAMSDPLGDMLSRIRNAQSQRSAAVDVPASKLRANVLDVLAREGYIRGYASVDAKKSVPFFSVELKYNEGEPVIKESPACRSPAAAFTRRSRICRNSTAALAFRSCPRRVA